MDCKIIDVLEPFEEECLFSWVVRMLRDYSPAGKVENGYVVLMKRLFGEKVFFPGLYFQNGLDYFLENHLLKECYKLSSVEHVLQEMTVLPFYNPFLSEKRKMKCVTRVANAGTYVNLESFVNIRCSKTPLEGKNHIKFCPQCFEKKYLKREHQIPGNLVCYEHNEVLHYFEYKPHYKVLNFADNIQDSYVYNLNDQEIKRSYTIAVMVHQIFREGLKVEVVTLKQKIRSRMRSLGYLNEDYNFYDISSFVSVIGNDVLSDDIDKCMEVFQVVYDVDAERGTNPLFYLWIIEFLFGSLDALYNYEIEFEHGPVFKTYYYPSWDMQKQYTLEYYCKTMKKEYFEEYKLIGDTVRSIIVLHKKCGTFFCSEKNRYTMSICRRCTGEIKAAKRSVKVYKNSGEYKHYLNVREYAARYGKESRQIRIYCEEGRLDGAIWCGKKWLIPEDAPYPKDRRKKHHEENNS